MSERLFNESLVRSSSDRDSDTEFYTSPGFIYVAGSPHRYKIGCAVDPQARIYSLQSIMPFELVVEALIETKDMFQAESYLHRRFAEKHIRGEWFRLEPEDLTYLRSLNCLDFEVRRRKKRSSEEIPW